MKAVPVLAASVMVHVHTVVQPVHTKTHVMVNILVAGVHQLAKHVQVVQTGNVHPLVHVPAEQSALHVTQDIQNLEMHVIVQRTVHLLQTQHQHSPALKAVPALAALQTVHVHTVVQPAHIQTPVTVNIPAVGVHQLAQHVQVVPAMLAPAPAHVPAEQSALHVTQDILCLTAHVWQIHIHARLENT